MSVVCDWEWNGQYPTKKTWRALKALLEELGNPRWHCFWDEPWSPWVVRIIELDADVKYLPPLGKGEWVDVTNTKMAEDRGSFGDYFPAIEGLFTAAANIAMQVALDENEERPPLMFPAKLVHCLMNMWGYTRADEAKAYGDWAVNSHVLHAIDGQTDDETFWNIYRRLPRHKERGRLDF